MEKHVDEGGTADVGPDVMAGNGFPVGAWVLEMRRRGESGDLGGAHVRLLEQLPGWRWNG